MKITDGGGQLSANDGEPDRLRRSRITRFPELRYEGRISSRALFLQSTVFPNLLRNRSADNPIRIWVAGCSTGEEVYSVAIALLEVLGDMATNTPIKILATDINDAALQKARAGTYIDNIALDVSPDRLRRFINQVNSHYQICKSVRDLCVFSTHNVDRDTPFANLELISCRNLPALRYMAAAGGRCVRISRKGGHSFSAPIPPVADATDAICLGSLPVGRT